MQQGLYYRHSGKFPMAALPFGLLIGSVAGGALAVVYSYVTLYCPIIYLNLLLALVYGYAVGWCVARSMVWLNVRNGNLMHGVSFLAVAVSLYVAWAVWVCGVLGRGHVDVDLAALAKHPRVLGALVLTINERGTWALSHMGHTHGSPPVSGLALWLVWVGEALLIFGAAVVAIKAALAVPFCETCQKWCRKRPIQGTVNVGDVQLLRERLEGADLQVLEQLGPAPVGTARYCNFEVYSCPECEQTNTLSVNSVTITRDRQGKTHKRQTKIIDRLLLDREKLFGFEKLRGFTASPKRTSSPAEVMTGAAGLEPSDSSARQDADF